VLFEALDTCNHLGGNGRHISKYSFYFEEGEISSMFGDVEIIADVLVGGAT